MKRCWFILDNITITICGYIFQELNIPKPDYNLGISGGSHGDMTGKMIISLEK